MLAGGAGGWHGERMDVVRVLNDHRLVGYKAGAVLRAFYAERLGRYDEFEPLARDCIQALTSDDPVIDDTLQFGFYRAMGRAWCTEIAERIAEAVPRVATSVTAVSQRPSRTEP